MIKGVNTKTHDRTLPTGELSVLDNAHATKVGELRKRKGFRELSNSVPAISPGDAATEIGAGKAIASFNDEILVFDGRYGYSKTSTSDKWVNKGGVIGCALDGELVSANSNLIQAPAQIAQANGFEVHAWSEIDPAASSEGIDSFTGTAPEGPVVIETPIFTGAGQSTMTTGGTYGISTITLYRVTINDDYPTPNTFDWVYDVGGGWQTGGSGINITGSAQSLSNGVTVTFGSTSGYTKGNSWDFKAGKSRFRLTGFTDHNYEVGTIAQISFASNDWTDGEYVCTEVIGADIAIFDYVVVAPDVSSSGSTIIINGETWKTYTKILDKTTRAEIVGKTLINKFITGTTVHNVPRVQIAAQGDFIVVFVYVGSGRVKHVAYNTANAPNTSFLASELVNDSSDVTFEVDIFFPHWHVQSTNYVDGASVDGFVVLRRHDGINSQVLRTTFFRASESNGVISVSEEGTPAPRITTESIFFKKADWSLGNNLDEVYTSAEGQIQIAAGLMLSVVRNPTSGNDEHIVIGYTKSISGTTFIPPGSSDEPGGVKLITYDAQLIPKNECTLSVDGVTSAFTDGTTSGINSGYALVQGTAARTPGMVTDGDIRAFVTLIKNVSTARLRVQSHRVSAFDLPINNTNTFVDKDLDLNECALSSSPFNYGDDFFLQISYGTRPNSLGGVNNTHVFNNSTDMLINHEGLVFAKGPSSAGSVSLDMNINFMQNRVRNPNDLTETVEKRVNLLQSLPRAIQDEPGGSVFRWGSSRYSGVATNSDGTDITAMLASAAMAEMNPKRYLPSVEANGSLNIASGILWEYSGDYFRENNFFYWPEIKRAKTETLSQAVGVGKYSYIALYEWVSADGRVERSTPSIPMTIDTTNDGSAQRHTLYVYTLQLTHRQDFANSSAVTMPSGVAPKQWGTRALPKIVLYRTEAGKSRFYRCAEEVMDPKIGIQGVTDTLPDSSLIDNPDVYTFGGSADNMAPPSCRDLALWKERLWLATSENDILYSKRFRKGLGTSFSSPAFTIPSDNGAEKITALCPNVEALMVLGESNGYYVTGEGPLDSGIGGAFSPLRVFGPGQGTLDGGCRVETPAGVFFQTRQGLMTVTPSLQVKFGGARAEGLFDSTNYLTDGVVFEGEDEIRFTSVGNGRIVVYNYLLDLWSSFNLNTSLGDNSGSVIVGGSHYRLGVNGVVYKQHDTDCTDLHGGVEKPYAFGFETGWINVGQLQQLGRVYRLQFLGDFNASSKAQVYLFTDYVETAEIVETAAAPGTVAKQLVCKLPKQKVRALKFGFTESTPTPGDDFRVQSVSMLVGIKQSPSSFKEPVSSQISAEVSGH